MAFDELKRRTSSMPVLRYYDQRAEVTLQCDASQSGLGAALLQNGQPVAFASRAETRYAQIEKELLAIVFACTHFDAYLFGRELATIQTDHKPLEMIVKKPLRQAPQRLQRMLLVLQRYNLNVTYQKGELMHLADTLSRAHPVRMEQCELASVFEEVDHKDGLPVSTNRWQQIRHAAQEESTLRQLREVIHRGWPDSKSDLPECVHAYFDCRDELTVQGVLVFKGLRLVVPAALRRDLIAVAHSTYIGIEGCLRRLQEYLFWPRMTPEVREYIAKFDVCMFYRNESSKEPIVQHKFDDRPWSKIAVDLCELLGRSLLVIVDFYNNFIEVANVSSDIKIYY